VSLRIRLSFSAYLCVTSYRLTRRRTHARTVVHTHAHTRTRTHTYARAHTHARVHPRAHTHPYTYTHTGSYMRDFQASGTYEVIAKRFENQIPESRCTSQDAATSNNLSLPIEAMSGTIFISMLFQAIALVLCVIEHAKQRTLGKILGFVSDVPHDHGSPDEALSFNAAATAIVSTHSEAASEQQLFARDVREMKQLVKKIYFSLDSEGLMPQDQPRETARGITSGNSAHQVGLNVMIFPDVETLESDAVADSAQAQADFSRTRR
jgi:hypothetical protein